MRQQYTEEKKQSVLKKLLPPYNMPIPELSRAEGIPTTTLYSWRSEERKCGNMTESTQAKSTHFNAAERLQIIIETASLSELELGEYCRKKGIYTHDIQVWKDEIIQNLSESAVKLMQSYGKDLNFEEIIKNIIAVVNCLDSSFKHDAAKSCIARIAAPNYTFMDSSGISTRQLLVLAFTAIHDETKRQGTLKDALVLFVEGFYEIQRGYNLSENGIDNQSPDAPICSAGTFNKLMEKLNEIHPDVEVYFITHEGAYVKFPKLVERHVLDYLNSLVCPETVADYLLIKELLDSLQANGVEPIWDKIKSDVEAEIWAEFHEAYASNRNHQQFREIIDSGNDSNAPKLSEHYLTLETSPGYQAFLYQIEQKSLEEQTLFLRLQQHSLWANRHESADAQHAFDSRYGLVMINCD